MQAIEKSIGSDIDKVLNLLARLIVLLSEREIISLNLLACSSKEKKAPSQKKTMFERLT